MKKILITLCLFNTVACGAFSPIEDGEYNLVSIEFGGVRKAPTAAEMLSFSIKDGFVQDEMLDEAGVNDGSPSASSSDSTDWICDDSSAGEVRLLIRGLLAAGVAVIKPALRVGCSEEGSEGTLVLFDRESDVQLVFERHAESSETSAATTPQSLGGRSAKPFRPFALQN